MINHALAFIVAELNTYLKSSLEITENKAILSPLNSGDGNAGPGEDNKIYVHLLNIEQEKILNVVKSATVTNGITSYKNTPIYINILFLVAAKFKSSNYSEGLKFLSAAIAFFQGHPTFTVENAPRIENGIDKLTIELVNMSYQDLNHVWGIIGAKQLPCVAYRMKMLNISMDSIIKQQPAIRDVSVS